MLVDHILGFFTRTQKWADANGYGNEHAVLGRIIRDLETLRALPDDALRVLSDDVEAALPVDPAQSADTEVDSPPETDVNSGDGSTSDE
jgi:hypothetical protein